MPFPDLVLAVAAQGLLRRVVLLPKLAPVYRTTLTNTDRETISPTLIAHSKPGDFIAFSVPPPLAAAIPPQQLDSGYVLQLPGLQHLVEMLGQHNATAYKVNRRATERDREIVGEVVGKKN